MTPAIERVVLGTDGSDNAVRAADHALALAAAFGADLHVVSATGPSTGPLGRLADAVRVRAAVEAEEAVAAVTRKALVTDVGTTTAVVDGPPASVVVGAGREADLVVLGRHGRTAIGRFLVGSVTERVLDDPPVPTLVVPADADPTPAYETVALLVEDSVVGRAAADLALAVARVTGARLAPLAVVDDRFAADPKLREALEADARSVVEDVAVRAAGEAVASDAAVEIGVPAAELLAHAAATAADLLVVGTDAARSLDRHGARNVARRVVRQAAVPVLVVPIGTGTEPTGDAE